jgi:maleylacetoacetate isomerase
MKLYSYWRSSAAYRVRIALNLKGLKHEIVPVNMLKDGGEQHSQQYQEINPQELVPTLVDGEITLTQSMAIIEYLDEKYPQINLMPADIENRARVRQLAQITACDIHPLNNLRVLKYLKKELNVEDDDKDNWYQHWIIQGFNALEESIKKSRLTGPYCMGEKLSLVDLCLIPQMYNAHRFKVSMENYPILSEIEKTCLALDAFQQATPEKQIDAI